MRVPVGCRHISAAAPALERPCPEVNRAVARFEAGYDGGPVQAALLARNLTLGERGRLVDGAWRLAMVADENIISAGPCIGAVIGHRPVTDMTGNVADVHGRFLVGFQQPQGELPRRGCCASGRAARLAGVVSPGRVVVRRLIDVWAAW